jgi:hypothetical protein
MMMLIRLFSCCGGIGLVELNQQAIHTVGQLRHVYKVVSCLDHLDLFIFVLTNFSMEEALHVRTGTGTALPNNAASIEMTCWCCWVQMENTWAHAWKSWVNCQSGNEERRRGMSTSLRGGSNYFVVPRWAALLPAGVFRSARFSDSKHHLEKHEEDWAFRLYYKALNTRRWFGAAGFASQVTSQVSSPHFPFVK